MSYPSATASPAAVRSTERSGLVPEWLAQNDLTGKDHAEDVGRSRTATLAVRAGIIAGAGAILTGLSYQLNQAAHITERFGRAIDQLGSGSLDVRLGGIYALERIAKDSRHDHPQVMEVLTAYVREHPPWPPRGLPEEVAAQLDRGRITTDVQAAMSAIGRRRTEYDTVVDGLDLTGTDLRRLRLIEDGARLWRSSRRGSVPYDSLVGWGGEVADEHSMSGDLGMAFSKVDRQALRDAAVEVVVEWNARLPAFD